MSHHVSANLAWPSFRSHRQVKEESERLEIDNRKLLHTYHLATRQAADETARITDHLTSRMPRL